MDTGILHERRPRRATYDAASDTLALDLSSEGASGGTTGAGRSVKASLLLDAKGFLVGVDLRDDAHIIVMLGEHEAVAKQVDARLLVVGQREITEVRIPRAKGQVRGHERNPYL